MRSLVCDTWMSRGVCSRCLRQRAHCHPGGVQESTLVRAGRKHIRCARSVCSKSCPACAIHVACPATEPATSTDESWEDENDACMEEADQVKRGQAGQERAKHQLAHAGL